MVCLWCLWSFGTNNSLMISCYISKINPDSTKVLMPQANPCGNFMRLKPKNGLVSTPTHEEDSTVVHAVFFSRKVSVLVWTAYSLKPEYHSVVLPLKMHLPCSSLRMLLQTEPKTVCWSYTSADFSFSFMRRKKRTGGPFQSPSEAALDPAGPVNSVFGLGISGETHTGGING